MRIVGGNLRGKRLLSVPGLATRPTSDRIRESIFNILSHRVSGAVVLDLYAGTGALGLEAMSRGGDYALFIDAGTEAVRTIRNNIHACRLEERTEVIRWDLRKNLHCLERVGRCFDLVFMDPPYEGNYLLPTIRHLAKSLTLRSNALLVVEHSIREDLPEDIAAFVLSDRRKYGKTLVSFFNCLYNHGNSRCISQAAADAAGPDSGERQRSGQLLRHSQPNGHNGKAP